MVSLLERFYDPNEGAILLDGIDIKVSTERMEGGGEGGGRVASGWSEKSIQKWQERELCMQSNTHFGFLTKLLKEKSMTMYP